MKPTLTVACTVLKSAWQAVSLRSALTALLLAPLAALHAADRPNILWIITDDQRHDSIAAFNRIHRNGKADSPLGAVLSPNVDRIASMGTTFINNFNHNPSCQPSRTIMHTGRYSHRTGVYGFEYHNPSGMTHWKPMVPEILRDQAGYQTITVGKLGLYAQHFANKKNPNGPLLYETNLGYRTEFAAAGLVDWNAEKKWVQGKKGKGRAGVSAHPRARKGTKLTVEGNLLVLQCTGDDPGLAFDRLAISQPGPYTLEFKLQSHATGSGELDWTTDANTNLPEGKHLAFDVKHDGEWHEHILHFNDEKKMHAFRLDPCGGAGEMRIDGLIVKAADGKVLAKWP